MKGERKRLGIKAKIRAEKEKERHIATVIFTALILLLLILSAYFGYSFLNQPQNQTVSSGSTQPKAAIVDHLSLTFPNQTFIQTATNTLKQAGYTVDYYPAKEATVDFYRKLPTYGYDLIILRVHSAIAEETTRLVLFTSEPYSQTKYVYEQLTGQIGIVAFLPHNEGEPLYFGAAPKFVKESMNGKFNNTIIIMMGCEGLKYPTMAEAFIEKGAKAVIGWNASVSASHTDIATTTLLQHLITEKQTIKQAVENTIKEVGPDPAENSILLYHPLEAGEQTIENIG